jgi:suppressor for copper-sensitivity B
MRMSARLLLIRYLGLFLAILLAAPALAQHTPPKPDFGADLVSGGSDSSDPEIAWLGLLVRLGPGWHTYWRSPGEAGAPPKFDWDGSENFAGAVVQWPVPRRFSESGIDTFGYADRVLFPIRLRLRNPSAPARVLLTVHLYVCSTICTSNQLHFERAITPGVRSPESQALIDEWRDKVPPASSNTSSISIRSLQLDRGPRPRLRVEVKAQPPLQTADAFVDGDNAITADHPVISPEAGGLSVIDLPLTGLSEGHTDQPLHVTIVDGDRSVEGTVSVPKSVQALKLGARSWTRPANAQGSFWWMIALSLVGGLILNFMPCVFPVLSLKLFSLVAHGTSEIWVIRGRFVASAAGVIASFLVLAFGLIIFKAAGAQIGWGIQFQQPLFLIFITGVLVALAGNLLDLYEIRLPLQVAGWVGHAASGQSAASHFFNGFVITLLATPCSAPFVGTAVAFALSQGPIEIITIFLCLGVGMGAPYLVLAAVPQLARLFPRPGRWMVTLRYLSAMAIAGTAAWLLIVLAQVSSTRTALFVGGAFGFLVWLMAVRQGRLANAIGVVILATLMLVAAVGAKDRLEFGERREHVAWRQFSPDMIRSMVSNGRTVFVDIGATWCITCKVNDAIIAKSRTIEQRLKSDVVPLRADWTKADPTIGRYLQSFGRYGLPFNAVFGPSAPDGILLPELLTEETVLHALETASDHHPN